MAGIGDWEIETGGTLGTGGEYSPKQYPRSEMDRDVNSSQNKNSASRAEIATDAVKINTDGNTNVPRHADTPINYYDDGDGDEVSEAKSGDEEGMYSQ